MPNISIYAISTILSIQTVINCLTATVGQYVYKYYLELYTNSSNQTSTYTETNAYNVFELFNVNSNETHTCSSKNISRDSNAESWAQKSSAELFFWTSLVSSCPLIIMTYVFGLYTSKLGKRVVLTIPMLGTTIQLIFWLCIIYFSLSEIWWYSAAFINGLSGSGSLLGLTIALIVTENTCESERSSLFVRFGALQTGLSSIATFIIGYYISWRGFNDLYWLALALQILSIVIVTKHLTRVDSHFSEGTHLLSSTASSSSPSSSYNEITVVESIACRDFFKVFTVIHSSHRSQEKNISLFLTLLSNAFYTLGLTCFAPLLFYFLNAPFCWTSKDIGQFSALGAISTAFLSLLGMQILTYFGTSDVIICAISHVFFCVSSLWIAFAKYDWQLFVSLILNAFSGYQGSLTTSMMSKWLEIHERNTAFILVTEINTVIATFGNAFFNGLYAHTVVYQRNLVLLIAAGLSVIPFTLNILLFIVTRKTSVEEMPSSLLLSDNIESAPFHLESSTLPHAGDATCLIIPSRILPTTLNISPTDRTQYNSIDDCSTEPIINNGNDNLNIL